MIYFNSLATTIDGTQFFTYKFPELVDYAKLYFGCDTIEGIPVENSDSNLGSHWDKLFLPKEFMNPVTENPGIISKFTLLVLKYSGWYKVKIFFELFLD